MVGDYFSKWVESYPLPNQEAKTVAKVLVEEWVCPYGTPRSLHSDQGRNFESNLFGELCRLLGINKTRTTPYQPQSDGMIERFNHTLLSMLSFYVDDNQHNWDVLLPYVMMAYRSSVHSSTGFTPYKVLFGQEMVLPIDIIMNVEAQERFSTVNGYVERVAGSLSTVLEAVKRHQARASEHQKIYFDFKAQCQYYEVGELVWLKNKARRKGVSPKLQKRFKGPYRIVERISEVLYRIQPEGGTTNSVVHFNHLKPSVGSVFSGSDGGHVETVADQENSPIPTRRKRDKSLRFGSSWVFRRSHPLDLPPDVGHPQSSVLSAVAAGSPLRVSGLPTVTSSFVTSDQPAEAHVSGSVVPAAEGAFSLRRPVTPASPLMREGGDLNDLPVFAEQSPSFDPDAVGNNLLGVESNRVAEYPKDHITEGERPVRIRKPPVWFKDYIGTS